ncbi:hypothetical protein NPIL_257141 [Nephila pilipes]|uniref:Uncharacterized protein n=1 Tax=Nephila pilipes TaxID=299642 RepID=A0A8X6NGE7_NEPPI|nr:hypothetical protein NPIL_257141 [Nephila pilipes]
MLIADNHVTVLATPLHKGSIQGSNVACKSHKAHWMAERNRTFNIWILPCMTNAENGITSRDIPFLLPILQYCTSPIFNTSNHPCNLEAGKLRRPLL